MTVWILSLLGLTGAGIGGAALLGFGPAMLLFGGKFLKGILSWLGTLSFWQIAFGAALIFAGIQTVRLKAEQRHSAKLSAQIVKLDAQLKAITSAKSEQRTVTKDRIVQMTKIVHDGNEKAKVVETAPLPGNCKTPPQILGADL